MKLMKQIFSFLQQIGKSLMLPVSILPVAGILLGVGGAFLSGIDRGAINIESEWLLVLFQIMKNSGEPIFASLPLIFAIGVALGVSKNDGVASLAAVVGFVVLTGTMGALAKLNSIPTKPILGIASIDTGVFGGILIGLMAGFLFNKYYKINLPTYLGFFSGKRFVPIVTAFSAIFLGLILSYIWPPIQGKIDSFSNYAVNGNPMLSVFAYGLVERSLLPFGLHHIWNVPFFFEIGEFINSAGQSVTGEIPRFFAGDPTAGNLGGGYLFKMFGLPAAAIAIWRTARPEKKKLVGSIMLSAALTSFLTGITEPIEFAFLFVAPALYGIHAVLSGLAFVVMYSLGAKLGYTFSHGFIDYVLFYAMGTKAWLVMLLGPIYFVIYYFIFKKVIEKFDLKTPGREIENLEEKDQDLETLVSGEKTKAEKVLQALGGQGNILDIDACITRLRLKVKDSSLVKDKDLKFLGAAGVLRMGDNIQVIFGTESDILKTEIIELGSKKNNKTKEIEEEENKKNDELKNENFCIEGQLEKYEFVFGGKSNISSVEQCAKTRMRVEVKDTSKIVDVDFDSLGLMRVSKDTWHIILNDRP